MKRIVTIGREFGSGGRELGRRLAEALGFDYYDREILTEIARHTSLSEEYVRHVVEGKPHTLYPITVGQSFAVVPDYGISQMQTIYRAQSEIITGLAEQSDCVIVGRCADYILRDSHPIRLFVHASLESRVRRCIERGTEGDLTEKEVTRQIRRIDRDRAGYYRDYTGRTWGDKDCYDLCVNTTGLEIKQIVPPLARMLTAVWDGVSAEP